MLRAVGHPVAVNPDAELARVAAEEGWDVLRFETLGRRVKILVAIGAAAAARLRRPHRRPADRDHHAMSLPSSPTSSARSATWPGASPTRSWRRRPRPGTPSGASRKEVLTQLGELGLMGVCVPEALGGVGAGHLTYALVLEELSRADAGLGVTLAVHTGAGTLPIVAHGTEDQRLRLVPPLAQGHELAAFALTESESGSDAAAMRASADEQDRLTGTKQWITNGSHAHVFTVFARDARAGGRPSAFVVRRGARGLPRRPRGGEARAALLQHGRPRLRGRRPRSFSARAAAGMRIALATLDGGRIGIAAQAVGIAQAALDVAVAYAKERRTFGVPIGAHQAIQQKLADMSTEVEAARALTWRAARAKDGGRPHTVEGAQAKLFASGVARRVTGEAIQVLGRPRLHPPVPGRALLPRRQGDGDLRRHERDPAARHRPRAAGRRRAGHPRLSRPAAGRARPPARRGAGRTCGCRAAHVATPGRHLGGGSPAREACPMNPSLIGIAHAKAHQPFPTPRRSDRPRRLRRGR